MKKFISSLLCLLMLLALVACGNEPANNGDSNSTNPSNLTQSTPEQTNSPSDEDYSGWYDRNSFAVWSYPDSSSDDFSFKTPYPVVTVLTSEDTRGDVYADEDERIIVFLPQDEDEGTKKDLKTLFETEKEEIITVVQAEYDDFTNISFQITQTETVTVNQQEMVRYVGKMDCHTNDSDMSIPLMGYALHTPHEAYALWFILDATDLNEITEEGADIITKVAQSYELR